MGFEWGRGGSGLVTGARAIRPTGFSTPCGRQDWPGTRAFTIFELTVNEYKL